MNDSNTLGFSRPHLPFDPIARTEHVLVQNVLHRVLAFTGHSIDDVVNSWVAKQHVRGYYKLHRWVEREGEISEMERAWNPLGRRT